jgi:thiamine biosynthesis protein ThiI
MNPDFVMLRLGELTLKGRNRYRFEQTVLQQVRERLQPYSNIRFTREFGRIYLQLNGEPYSEIAARLGQVFGLYSFSPVMQAPLDLPSIRETALQLMKSLPSPPATFKVSTRRSNKSFPYDSIEMNHMVGGYILAALPQLKVDVHRPEVELKVEIRGDTAYIYSSVEKGLGGFPAGSNGKAMLMLSGGIDSPVAGWLSMKRGLAVEAVHFHSYPYTSERAKDKVVQLAKKLAEYTDSIRLHFVAFTELQTKLHQAYKGNLEITMMRRAMFRITEKLALLNGAGAIVTGESLGQVASQTLASLDAIGRVVEIPLLRPLITMDKTEIIAVAERIRTYSISILPYEDCCTLFLPKSPSTKPNLALVEHIESRLDWLEESIARAVEQTETITVTSGDEDPINRFF